MALTIPQLAEALRIVGSATETVPAATTAILTRQLAVARALITAHAPTAPELVADEAAVRLCGFLFDQDPALPRSQNPMVASGAGSVLGPWHTPTLAVPAGSVDAAARAAGLTGAQVVELLTALAGNARLPASAVRDLPSGGSGGGLTADDREVLESAVQIDNAIPTPALSGASINFQSDGGDAASINLSGITHPQPEVADVGKVLQATAVATTDWRDGGLDEAAVDARVNTLVPVRRRVPTVQAGDTGQILTAPQSVGGQPTWEPAQTGGSGLNQAGVDARVNALIPTSRRVPAVGAGDVGRILTAPQSVGGQPTWNSNPGQTAAQVTAAVRAGVADWAEQGDASAIPANKLTNAPGAGGGLNQAAVDARVKAGVLDWAEADDHSRIPEAKLPAKVDDFADALSGGGFTDPDNDAATEAFVSTTWSTVQKPANAGSRTFVNTFNNSPEYSNVYPVIRVPAGVDRSDLRFIITEAGVAPKTFAGDDWVNITDNYWTTATAIANVPVGVQVRVQRYRPFTLDGPAVGVESWATVGGGLVPRDRIPESRFVTELVDQVRGIAISQANRSVQQTLTAFTTPLTLTDADHGVLLVSIQATSANTQTFLLGDDAQASVQAYLSVLRGSDAYAGDGATKGNGTLIGTFEVFSVSAGSRGTKQGEVKAYVARNAANQVGTYAVYDPESGASGTLSASISLTWEVTLLRTDASAAAAGGLGSPTMSGTFSSYGNIAGIVLPATGKFILVGSCDSAQIMGYIDMETFSSSEVDSAVIRVPVDNSGNIVVFNKGSVVIGGFGLNVTWYRSATYAQASSPSLSNGKVSLYKIG